MSTTDGSRSPSDPEGLPRRRTRFRREGWRELNGAQLVCIAVGTVAAMFGLFAGVLAFLSALISWGAMATETVFTTATIPSVVALACALGALLFTRSSDARRAARQECGPAVLMALSGLLGVAIAWAIG